VRHSNGIGLLAALLALRIILTRRPALSLLGFWHGRWIFRFVFGILRAAHGFNACPLE